MSNLTDVVAQLAQERTRVAKELQQLDAALAALQASPASGSGSRILSASARERIAAAQRARWARVRAAGTQKANIVAMPRKHTLSAAARKRIAAAQKARWAAWKAKQKKSA